MKNEAEKYYRVLCCDNQRKYAYFRLGIKWNVSVIANEACANGYIVQQLSFANDTKIRGIPDESYYEAWKVVNGECVDAKDDRWDDLFSWGCSGFLSESIKNSIGKSGAVVYKAQVYWVKEGTPLYSIVDKWEKNWLSAAGNLNSCFTEKCQTVNFGEPVFVRPDFIHQVEFTDPQVIKTTIVDWKKNVALSPEEIDAIVEEMLIGTEYESLIEELK